MENIFSEIIKSLREKKNLSQRELAKAIDIGQTTIAKWENGLSYPTLPNLIKLARFFGVTIDYLAGDYR